MWAQSPFRYLISGRLTFFSIFIIAKWLFLDDLPTHPHKNYKAFRTLFFSGESKYTVVSEWFLLASYKYFTLTRFKNSNIYWYSFFFQKVQQVCIVPFVIAA